MSDRRQPYGDDPSSSPESVDDPGVNSGYNNPYCDDPIWDSDQPTAFVDHPCRVDDSTTSDTGSDDSVDSQVQRHGLQMCGTRPQARKRNKKKRQHQPWVATWDKIMASPKPCTNNYFVCIDGYYRPGRKGGYGVLIRDNLGKPIVASSVTSTEAVSFLYHIVQGVWKAVKLAVQHSLTDIQLFCNAKHFARFVNQMLGSFTMGECCRHVGEYEFDVVCKSCVKHHATTEEEADMIFALLKDVGLMLLQGEFIAPLMAVKVERSLNKAADFLAKNGAPAGTEELSPGDFPDELKEILCNDYVNDEYYGLPTRCQRKWFIFSSGVEFI